MIGCIARAQSGDEMNLFRLAQTYEQASQWETALRYYQDLYKRQPMNANYFEGVRRSLTQLKKYSELIDLIKGRLTTTPQDLQLYAYLGSAYYRNGDEAQAFNTWETAIKINPLNTSTYRLIADQAIDNKLYKRAVDYLLRGREAGGNKYLFVPDVARAYAMQMNFKEAMQEYVLLLIDNPGMLAEVERQIAQYTGMQEGFESAMFVVKEALEDHSDNVALMQLLAWLAMEVKDYDTAYKVYEDIDRVRRAGGSDILSFARRAYDEKSFATALKAYKYLADKYSGQRIEGEARFYYIRCIEELNIVTDSIANRKAAGENVAPIPASEAIPTYSGAISLYEKLVQEYPQHSVGIESMYRIGYLKYYRFHDLDGALKMLGECAEARRSMTGTTDADVLIGDILIAQGKLEEARAQYQRVLSFPILTPEQKTNVEFKIAEVAYFEGKFDDAVKALQPLTQVNSFDVANDALGLSMFIADSRKPTDAPLREYAKAALLHRQRKYSEASAIVQNLIVSFPSSILVDRSYIFRAELERKSGQEQQAILTLESFLAKYTDSILRDRAQFDLAELYQSVLHNKEKAVDLYQSLLRDFPNSLLSNEARRRILFLRNTNL